MMRPTDEAGLGPRVLRPTSERTAFAGPTAGSAVTRGSRQGRRFLREYANPSVAAPGWRGIAPAPRHAEGVPPARQGQTRTDLSTDKSVWRRRLDQRPAWAFLPRAAPRAESPCRDITIRPGSRGNSPLSRRPICL